MKIYYISRDGENIDDIVLGETQAIHLIRKFSKDDSSGAAVYEAKSKEELQKIIFYLHAKAESRLDTIKMLDPTF